LLPGAELAFEKEVQCEAAFVFRPKIEHKVAVFREINKDESNVHHNALEVSRRKNRPTDAFVLRSARGRVATTGAATGHSQRQATARFTRRVASHRRHARLSGLAGRHFSLLCPSAAT
jgi:hypothetical protein